MKTGNGRRTFVIKALLGTTALATTKFGFTQPAKLQESDPQAVALHYKDDAKRVDKSKYPKYEPGQVCLNCQLYQGNKPPSAPCAIFGNKLVAAEGWCSAWVKKAGA